MKKLIIISAIALFGNLGQAIAQKIAHVDFQRIMLSLPERKVAEDSLKKEADKFQADANKMKMKLDQLMLEYSEAKKAGGFSTPEAEQMSIDNIQDYQGRMQQFQDYAEDALVNKENAMLKPMIDKVKASVSKMMKANGINYVLDKSSLVEIDGGFDLTPLIAKDLGITLIPEKAVVAPK